jgi:hypothetical protein
MERKGRSLKIRLFHFERNPYKVPSFVRLGAASPPHALEKILPILSMSPKAPPPQDKLLERGP